MTTRTDTRRALVALSLAFCCAGCGNDAPAGLSAAAPGEGPAVRFDVDAKPLPDIPFPNDLATRPDPTSPTGRRINISLEASTALESRVRAQANTLDGFATYGPISVAFDAPIDALDVWRRHNDDDPDNDALYVLNADPSSPRFGERVALDLGGGRFPVVLRSTDGYFPNDPRAGASNLLFETVDEDLDHDGVLDPGEDTDSDGVLDTPNLFPGGTDPIDDLMTFYERETHTLIARPVRPLDEQTTYAVILTTRVTGEDPEPSDALTPPPVRSPFAWTHHTRQAEALAPAFARLSELGLSRDEVAFAWTFTTQSVTRDLAALRRGLYGHGPFAWIADAVSPRVTRVDAFRDPSAEEPHLLRREVLLAAFDIIAGVILTDVSPEAVDALGASYENIDYIVAGSFDAPSFLLDRDGLSAPGYPANDDEIWEIDATTGEARGFGTEPVAWICFIPKASLRPTPGEPFPVSLYAHRFGSTRFEVLGYAGFHARLGLATCAIDAAGHGLPLPPELLDDVLIASVLKQYDVELLIDVAARGRARDLNNDGQPDSGGDVLTSDMLHTRDMLRQSVLDWMAFVRVLRGFDGVRRWELEAEEEGAVALSGLAGDFDGDGVVDIGGSADLFMWGQSLGGILSSMVAALEPSIVAAAPVSGGGGLTDIAIRSEQAGLLETVWLRVLGPLVLLRPPLDASGAELESDARVLSWYVTDVINQAALPFAELSEVEAGDVLRLTNLRSGESMEVVVGADRRARLAVASDAWSATEKRARLGIDGDPVRLEGDDARAVGDGVRVELFDGETGALLRSIDRFEVEAPWQGVVYAPGAALVAPMAGLGMKRQTPRLRRFLGVAQTLVSPADPINYAARYPDPIRAEEDPLEDGVRRVLQIGTLGDMGVPINALFGTARAAGVLSPEGDALLVDNFAYEALARLERFGPEVGETLFDPDDLDGDADGFEAPSPAPLLRAERVEAEGARSGLRLAFIAPGGAHTFTFPSPQKAFDIETFLIHQIGTYFLTRGQVIADDACLEDGSCGFLP